MSNSTNIPQELLELPQWIIYTKEKIPLQRNGKTASSTNPSHWSSFDEAFNSAKDLIKNKIRNDIAGLGFVFTETDPYIGIDLDDCFSGETLKPWAKKILDKFSSYSERSPSGRGLHIIIKGTKPGKECKRILQKNSESPVDGTIEMYEKARYFTMTGKIFDPELSIIEERQAELDEMYFKIFPNAKEAKESIATPLSRPSPSCLLSTKEDVLKAIEESSQAEKFNMLMRGDILSYGEDRSRAVYALCSLLSFYTNDFEIVDSIFIDSGLNVEQWTAGDHKSKWNRLGREHFERLRQEAEARGVFYGSNTGEPKLSSAGDDFTKLDGGKIEKTGEKKKLSGEEEYQLHVDLLFDLYSDVGVDIFSGVLHGRSRTTGILETIFRKQVIGALKGECQKRGKDYKPARLENYLSLFETRQTPKLLIDIPLWDGKDRIGEMASCMKFVEPNVTTTLFADILKDWCSKMYGKVEDPLNVQNRCIILTGKQGIGKDVWVQSLLCALEHLLKDLAIDKFTKDADIAVTMGSSMVTFISEFDSTNVLATSKIKELITKPYFDSVRKYDRDISRLMNRCSVIGACNPNHVLRDITGNRRFLVFKLEGVPGEAISWEYPQRDMEYSLQILAQAKALWVGDYKTLPEHEAIMAALTEDYTPEDPAKELVEDFESEIKGMTTFDTPLEAGDEGNLFRVAELEHVLQSLGRNYGLPRRTVLVTLKAAGCQYRTTEARFYSTREVVKTLIGKRGKGGSTPPDEDIPF